MKMYIGNADFLYKCCTRNCSEFELMELIPFYEFEKAIESEQIVICSGFAYFKSFDVILKHIGKYKESNIVLNLGSNIKDMQGSFQKWEAQRTSTTQNELYF